MNNYTISFMNNNKPVLMDSYEHFDSMFEMFLELVEEALENKWAISDAKLYYRDVIIALDIASIIKIGTAIANFGIMITEVNEKTPIMVYSLEKYIVSVFSIDNEEVEIHIVGNRNKPYSIFPLSILTCNLKPYFKQWHDMVQKVQKQVKSVCAESKKKRSDHVINPLLQDNITLDDMNWTLQYYAPAELKKALALIDTNPEESKKILMVMDYMLSKGKR